MVSNNILVEQLELEQALISKKTSFNAYTVERLTIKESQ